MMRGVHILIASTNKTGEITMFTEQTKQLSVEKQKNRSSAMEKLKAKRKGSLRVKPPLITPNKQPRYDEVFESGIDCLD
jgi:hypothetical protein